jgi:hypothetical protein
MMPVDFLDNVVTRNVVHLGEARGSMRRAVNALLTLDAFAGVLFAHLESLGRLRWANDSKFREFLSEECPEFRIVRDAAFALKDGALTDPKKQPRFVKKADQVVSDSGAWDEAVQDRSAFDTKSVIWIETTDSSSSMPADIVTLAVLNYFETLIGRFEEDEG